MKTKDIKTVLEQLDSFPLPDKDKILATCETTDVKQVSMVPEASTANAMTSTTGQAGKITPAPGLCIEEKLSRKRFRFSPAMAAVLALVLAASIFAGYSIYAEAREYNAALAFFNEHNLSTEGLSRGEIKKVYRDITTSTFSYGKTSEIITKEVGGAEIYQQDPTPEVLNNLWNIRKSGWQHGYRVAEHGISYLARYTLREDPETGAQVEDKSYFEKYNDGKLVWSTEFPNYFHIGGFASSDDATLLYGSVAVDITQKSEQTDSDVIRMLITEKIMMLDKNGKIQWVWKHDNLDSNSSEIISSATFDGDHIVVFSKIIPSNNLLLRRFDREGKLLSSTTESIGLSGIGASAKLGDGYLVLLQSHEIGDQLAKLDSSGKVIDFIDYKSKNDLYFIEDMIEMNNKVYISASSVPKLSESEMKHRAGGRRAEIASVLDKVFKDDDFLKELTSTCPNPNERLTKLIRDNLTAVLLVCDHDTFEPREFYSIKGSLGGKLSKDENGQLVWEVESVTDNFFSFFSSSFIIGGKKVVYQYTFSEDGQLINQEQTGEIRSYSR